MCPLGLGGQACSGSIHGRCDSANGNCLCLDGFAGVDCSHNGTCNQTAGLCSGHGLCAPAGVFVRCALCVYVDGCPFIAAMLVPFALCGVKG